MVPEINIKTILYATDLSENARKAFAYAASLAATYRGRLILLHVLPEDRGLDSKVIGYVSEQQWESIKDRHIEEARQALIGKQKDYGSVRQVLEQFWENTSPSIEGAFSAEDIYIRRGNPVEEIMAQARKNACDLIVIGAHGMDSLPDAMLGNTARRLLRRSPVPVLTVR